MAGEWTEQRRSAYAREYKRAKQAGADPAICRLRAQRASRGEPNEPLEYLPPAEKPPSRGWEKFVKPSVDQLAEAERFRDLEHATYTAAFFGDPLPGRSALDRLSPEDRARLA